ncbi:hypothetical protein HK105_207247 [Polyrhizophydium stewartii]|uniref:AB hydrolase-1 domain-containing protein n=1 Tax=Polyrhizophydium stewartii TaxID=2732419 RepID=A0ABR4N144_9FUNG|nr:hypothetical protein HK105_002149 [Polyrhizophydium stewartii]
MSAPWTLLSAGVAAAAGTAVLLAYWMHVPSDHGELGNLADVSMESPYNEKFWETSAYADLPLGKTHYFLLGPPDGKKVVFVHGISCPGPCFPTFFNKLAERGYRVLVYDHYGRGYSSSPGMPHSQDLYVAQLALLLQKVGWTHFNIIGYSLGGAITAHFAAKYPEMVDRIVFIAPAGLMDQLPAISKVVRIPVFGPVLFHTLGRSLIAKASKSNLTLKPETHEENAHLVRLNSFIIKHHPGFLRAYHSTVLHFDFCNSDVYFARIEETHTNKTMAIWGTLDRVVPYENSTRLRKNMPSLRFVSKEGIGHSIVSELPLFCVDQIDAFLTNGAALGTAC